MKRIVIVSISAAVALLMSLLPVWNFSERIAIPSSSNPLWTHQDQPITSPLTDELKEQGFDFRLTEGQKPTQTGYALGNLGATNTG